MCLSGEIVKDLIKFFLFKTKFRRRCRRPDALGSNACAAASVAPRRINATPKTTLQRPSCESVLIVASEIGCFVRLRARTRLDQFAGLSPGLYQFFHVGKLAVFALD